jgi:N-ethylmaleimide reductase
VSPTRSLKRGSRIFAQLWHTGALSMSASDVNPVQQSVTPSGRKPTVAPRPMTCDEIHQTVADYGQAPRNAIEAGFDGVQIMANFVYLIAQFFNKTTNRRTDEYGGPIENRARFFFEILETLLEHVPANRVGTRPAR